MPFRFAGRAARPLAMFTFRFPVPVGVPVKAALIVPSPLMVAVPASVPASAPVMVTVGAASVGSYPILCWLDWVGCEGLRLQSPDRKVSDARWVAGKSYVERSVGFDCRGSGQSAFVGSRYGDRGAASVGSVAVPIPARLAGRGLMPLATATVRFPFPEGAPVKVTRTVPSGLIDEVAARVPLSVPVIVTLGAVSVGSYPEPMLARLAGG